MSQPNNRFGLTWGPIGLGGILAVIVLIVVIVQVIVGKPIDGLEEAGLFGALALARLT